MAKEAPKKAPKTAGAYVAIGIARNLEKSKQVAHVHYRKRQYHEIELAKDDSDAEVFAAIRKAVKDHGADCVIGFGKTTHSPAVLIDRADRHDEKKKQRADAAAKRKKSSDGV